MSWSNSQGRGGQGGARQEREEGPRGSQGARRRSSRALDSRHPPLHTHPLRELLTHLDLQLQAGRASVRGAAGNSFGLQHSPLEMLGHTQFETSFFHRLLPADAYSEVTLRLSRLRSSASFWLGELGRLPTNDPQRVPWSSPSSSTTIFNLQVRASGLQRCSPSVGCPTVTASGLRTRERRDEGRFACRCGPTSRRLFFGSAGRAEHPTTIILGFCHKACANVATVRGAY